MRGITTLPMAGKAISPQQGVRKQGAGWGNYSTPKRKKAAWSAGANSMQMLPPTTDTDSGFTVKGAKVFKSADAKRLNFICTLPASLSPWKGKRGFPFF